MTVPDRGVVLVNVLVVIAIAAALVLALAGTQDDALQRARAGAAAAEARALVVSAETSVVVALRRDLREAPEADHFAEPWAAVIQEEAVLATGRFSVSVVDLRGRFDLNRLVAPTVQDTAAFRALLTALQIRPEVGQRILAGLSGSDRLADADELAVLGIDGADIDRLKPHVAALPLPGPVNLNTAGEALLTAILGNRIDARRLLQVRNRQGFVTPDDLAGLRIVVPPGAGFASDMFEMVARADVDGTTAALTARLQRVRSPESSHVRVVSRRFGPATLSGMPRMSDLFPR